mgnify:CR=1 FL=1
MSVMKMKNRDSELDDYVSKETYLLLEEKYNQSVESYNVLLHQLKQLKRAQFGTKSERFTDLFDGQQVREFDRLADKQACDILGKVKN